ncbi:MAG TPA: hypothetical protein VK870_04950 [Ignavibacteriaceae bacterium]|nr:hypothetical protein [Ignavibacteriaceae bacterium]
MKKGCFLKTIAILTIFVATIAYIIQNKLDDWIIEPGKKILLPRIEKGFTQELDFVTESVEKDSLFSIINNYLENIDFKKHDSASSEFWIEIKKIISDSVVNKIEIEKLQQLIRYRDER